MSKETIQDKLARIAAEAEAAEEEDQLSPENLRRKAARDAIEKVIEHELWKMGVTSPNQAARMVLAALFTAGYRVEEA